MGNCLIRMAVITVLAIVILLAIPVFGFLLALVVVAMAAALIA